MYIERRRASDQIFEELRRRIVSGSWADGEQLPTERELATEFDVSPNTVREAIRALGAVGLVDVRQGSGAFVRLSPAGLVSSSLGTVMRLETVQLADVLALSRHLHVRVVELAVSRATEEDLERLERGIVDPGDDARDNARQVGGFLQALAAAAHEPLLASIAWTLDRLIIEAVTAVYADDASPLLPELRKIRHNWADIAQSIRVREPARARSAVSAYFDACEAIIATRSELSTVRMSDEQWALALEDLSVGHSRAGL